MDALHHHNVEAVRTAFGESIVAAEEFRGEATLTVARERIVEVCTFVRDTEGLRYDLLADVFGIDLNEAPGRYAVVYNVYSTSTHHRMRLKVVLGGDRPSIPTVTGVWPAANWHERETFDMFGIVFEGHPDLRRLYMPEEFEYYPLRKDFPLMGKPGSLDLPLK